MCIRDASVRVCWMLHAALRCLQGLAVLPQSARCAMMLSVHCRVCIRSAKGLHMQLAGLLLGLVSSSCLHAWKAAAVWTCWNFLAPRSPSGLCARLLHTVVLHARVPCMHDSVACMHAAQHTAHHSRTPPQHPIGLHTTMLLFAAGLVTNTPIHCLPFMNTCGNSNYCSSGQSCINGKCSSAATTTTQEPATAATITVSQAAAAATPQQACLDARSKQSACSSDATPLLPANGTKLGYAVDAITQCFESSAFKCCAAPSQGAATPGVTSIVDSCKGVALLENAFQGFVNGTANFLQGLGSGANGTQAQQGQQTPILQPILQGMANVVTNISSALLKPLNSSSAARAAAAPSPSPVPKDYVNAAATGHIVTALVRGT